MERRVRKRALAFRRWAARQGISGAQAAAYLGLSVRTLYGWEAQWRRGRLRSHTRGRPAQRTDRATRQRLLALIELVGPHIGVPTLHALFPIMARREVEDLLHRYRRVWQQRHRRLLNILHWRKAGSVWAIDFAEPPLPVDGRFANLLAVRDLASGAQLLWLPVTDETAGTAIAGLEALFREHGAPLVLKSDNGSAFIAENLAALLERWQVWHLRSPREWPEYNGACEAGIGSMKTRTHHEAARRGMPGQWSSDDAEAARLQANETALPWGSGGPTPERVWRQRKAIRTRERSAFAATVGRLEHEARQTVGDTGPEALRRAAIGQALVAHRLLEYRRGGGRRHAPR